MTLEQFFQENPRCAIGFSGGVDSAYLLYAGKKYGAKIQPYFIKTAFQPSFELQDALKLAKQFDIKLIVLNMDVLSDIHVAQNPENRCYYCKKALFGALKKRAAEDGYTVLIDGTNASDDDDDRPGTAAIRELGVRSPLREAGLTKAKIRELSAEAGLFTATKPAYACLATRIRTGEFIDEETLHLVEKAENRLFELGYHDFRCRVYHGAAMLQFLPEEQKRAVEEAETLRRELLPYFDPVLLDLKPRGTGGQT